MELGDRSYYALGATHIDRTTQKCLHICDSRSSIGGRIYKRNPYQNLLQVACKTSGNENRDWRDGSQSDIFFIFINNLFEALICSEIQYGS